MQFYEKYSVKSVYYGSGPQLIVRVLMLGVWGV